MHNNKFVKTTTHYTNNFNVYSKIIIIIIRLNWFFSFIIGIEGREDLVAVEKLQARQEHHNDVGLE